MATIFLVFDILLSHVHVRTQFLNLMGSIYPSVMFLTLIFGFMMFKRNCIFDLVFPLLWIQFEAHIHLASSEHQKEVALTINEN